MLLAFRVGDVGKVVTKKSSVENAQHKMRRKENSEGSIWYQMSLEKEHIGEDHF